MVRTTPALAVSAGAAGGTMVTGFCAVLQEEPAMANAASTAIRILIFATRIFFYEIRIASVVSAR